MQNAFNYTGTGGTITVTMRVTWVDNQNWATLSGNDTGPGIPPEEQAHIFERFYRGAAARETRVGGMGLGLPVSRGIMGQHGGRLTVDSLPGEGSTFMVWLPLDEGSA